VITYSYDNLLIETDTLDEFVAVLELHRAGSKPAPVQPDNLAHLLAAAARPNRRLAVIVTDSPENNERGFYEVVEW